MHAFALNNVVQSAHQAMICPLLYILTCLSGTQDARVRQPEEPRGNAYACDVLSRYAGALIRACMDNLKCELGHSHASIAGQYFQYATHKATQVALFSTSAALKSSTTSQNTVSVDLQSSVYAF